MQVWSAENVTEQGAEQFLTQRTQTASKRILTRLRQQLASATGERLARVTKETGSTTLVADAIPVDDLRRRGTPQGPLRRLLRGFIHFFSYNLILKRPRTRVTHAAGFRLVVRPTVFHPRWFITSEFFADFIGGLDLAGKRIADVGTGTGILALAAVRAGAANVVAIDINPNAVAAAAENARANGCGERIQAVCSDLFAAVPRDPAFDVILSSPPSFPGEPRDLADRAWHAGPGYRDIAALFGQARERLAPDGCMYLLVSTDSDLDMLSRLVNDAGFRPRLVDERSILIESFLLYELRQLPDARPAQPVKGRRTGLP
jgi:release factor glutamine methyltransferase